MITLPTQEQLKTIKLPELIKQLAANENLGLTTNEAKARSVQFGFNEIVKSKKNPGFQFF